MPFVDYDVEIRRPRLFPDRTSSPVVPLPRHPFARSDRARTMGDEVQARAQRVRDHLQWPDPPDRQLTNGKARSAVSPG